MMDVVNWKEKLREALERTEFLCLGTITEDGKPWTNPLGFAYDEYLNLYVLSELKSLHIQNTLKDKNVSVSIYKTERFENGDIFGLQIVGKIERLVDEKELSVASEIYFSRIKKTEEFKGFTSCRGNLGAPWQFFKIVPEKVWCFDTREWKDGRKEIPKSDFRL